MPYLRQHNFEESKYQEQYNIAPNLTQVTIWESEKNTRKHHIQEGQEVSPFPAGVHKATKNKQDSMTKTNMILK